MGERLVVVGGDAAGMSAASQARRRRGPEDLEIVAFERGHFTYRVGGHRSTTKVASTPSASAPDTLMAHVAHGNPPARCGTAKPIS